MDGRRQDHERKPNIIQITWACGAAGVIYLNAVLMTLRVFGLI